MLFVEKFKNTCLFKSFESKVKILKSVGGGMTVKKKKFPCFGVIVIASILFRGNTIV